MANMIRFHNIPKCKVDTLIPRYHPPWVKVMSSNLQTAKQQQTAETPTGTSTTPTSPPGLISMWVSRWSLSLCECQHGHYHGGITWPALTPCPFCDCVTCRETNWDDIRTAQNAELICHKDKISLCDWARWLRVWSYSSLMTRLSLTRARSQSGTCCMETKIFTG